MQKLIKELKEEIAERRKELAELYDQFSGVLLHQKARCKRGQIVETMSPYLFDTIQNRTTVLLAKEALLARIVVEMPSPESASEGTQATDSQTEQTEQVTENYYYLHSNSDQILFGGSLEQAQATFKELVDTCSYPQLWIEDSSKQVIENWDRTQIKPKSKNAAFMLEVLREFCHEETIKQKWKGSANATLVAQLLRNHALGYPTKEGKEPTSQDQFMRSVFLERKGKGFWEAARTIFKHYKNPPREKRIETESGYDFRVSSLGVENEWTLELNEKGNRTSLGVISLYNKKYRSLKLRGKEFDSIEELGEALLARS